MVSLLVVEEGNQLSMMLGSSLEDDDYDVDAARDVTSALVRVRKVGVPDLMVVTRPVESPGVVDDIRAIRHDFEVPIIVVGARDDTREVVAALEAGADDYVAQPCEIVEIAARIRALRRRTACDPGKHSMMVLDRSGPLVLAPQAGTLRRGADDVHLTVTEFRVLCELAEAPGRVISRRSLLKRVWERSSFGDDRLVDVHVRRLRTKIEKNPSAPKIVVTVRGLGYRLDVA